MNDLTIYPFHLVLSALAHRTNREQAAIIHYYREENRLGSNRLRFTDASALPQFNCLRGEVRTVVPEEQMDEARKVLESNRRDDDCDP